MNTPQEPDCGSSSCMFSNKGGMRTNGPCRCMENAGFYGSAVMAAKQMLREVLMLRAELAALKAAHAWIKTSERMPEETCDVLGVVDGVVTLLNYDEFEDDPFVDWSDGKFRGYSVDAVSHWKPLPEAPK